MKLRSEKARKLARDGGLEVLEDGTVLVPGNPSRRVGKGEWWRVFANDGVFESVKRPCGCCSRLLLK